MEKNKIYRVVWWDVNKGQHKTFVSAKDKNDAVRKVKNTRKTFKWAVEVYTDEIPQKKPQLLVYMTELQVNRAYKNNNITKEQAQRRLNEIKEQKRLGLKRNSWGVYTKGGR